MNIFLTSSVEYLKHAIELIWSIRQHSKKELNVYLLIDADNDTTSNIQQKLDLATFKDTNIKLISNEYINEKLDDFYMSKISCFTKVTFGRLTIPYYFKDVEKFDKLLCLDCDVLVKNDGIDELYDTDISNAYCAACDDVAELYFDKKELQLCNIQRYFNNGVALLNLKKLKAEGFYEIIEKTLVQHHEFFEYSAQIDQSFVNYIFKQNVVFVDPKYNVQSNIFGYPQYDEYIKNYGYSSLNDIIEKGVIIHFNGRAKPWDDYNFVNWQSYQLPFRYWQKAFYENNKNTMLNSIDGIQFVYDM